MLVLTAVLAGLSRQYKIVSRFTELAEGLKYSGHDLPGSYQGWMKQLSKMGPAVLYNALELLRPTMFKRCGELWRINNWVPMAVDGSRFDLPHTQSNKDTHGTAGRVKCGPQIWVTLLTHLPTGLVWSWRQGPSRDSEQNHLHQMLDDLPDNVLLIGDAGFISYKLASKLNHLGKSFLLRIAGNKTLLTEISHDKIEKSPIGTRIIYWPGKAIKDNQKPLTLRLIVVGSGANKVYLVSNVLDSQKLSRKMAGEFYKQRWGIEVTYRSLKQLMARRKLRCGNGANAAVELAGNIMGFVVLALMGLLILRRQASKLSIAKALACIRSSLESLRWGQVWQGFLTTFCCALKDPYNRGGPKRSGTYPEKKNQTPPSPPKIRPMTTKELQLFKKLKKRINKTG